MSSIDYSSLISSTSSSTTDSTSSSSSATSITADDFLTLLVTELECQDPTEPMDNTEMVNQLTQYSQLDALTSIDDKLDTVTDSITAMTNLSGLDYLGKEVVADGYTVVKDEDDMSTLYFEIEDDAATMTINIYNTSGSIVSTETLTELEDGTYTYKWDGLDSDGDEADDGTYYVVATATDVNGDDVDVDTTTSGTVVALSNTDDGVVLTLDDGRTVNMSDVVYTTS